MKEADARLAEAKAKEKESEMMRQLLLSALSRFAPLSNNPDQPNASAH